MFARDLAKRVEDGGAGIKVELCLCVHICRQWMQNRIVFKVNFLNTMKLVSTIMVFTLVQLLILAVMF